MITGIFFWAERVGVQNIRLDIVNNRLQLGSNAVRIRDIAEYLRLEGAADVDIANFQYSVNQSHPHVDALDIRIVNVGNIDADQSAADNDALIGKCIFGILYTAPRCQHIGQPDPERGKMEREKDAEKDDQAGRYFFYRADQNADEKAVKADP